MSSIYQATNNTARNASVEDGNWLMGVAGIVADNDDPERQHRVRLIIPSIDEDEIYDEWARQMVFCLGDGFGSAFIPPKGSEVVLFGCLGQKYNLFYASLYNEEMAVPEGFDDEKNVGVHAPEDLTLIAEQKAEIKGAQVVANGTTVMINGDGTVSIVGGVISITGTTVSIQGRLVKLVGPPI